MWGWHQPTSCEARGAGCSAEGTTTLAAGKTGTRRCGRPTAWTNPPRVCCRLYTGSAIVGGVHALVLQLHRRGSRSGCGPTCTWCCFYGCLSGYRHGRTQTPHRKTPHRSPRRRSGAPGTRTCRKLTALAAAASDGASVSRTVDSVLRLPLAVPIRTAVRALQIGLVDVDRDNSKPKVREHTIKLVNSNWVCQAWA